MRSNAYLKGISHRKTVHASCSTIPASIRPGLAKLTAESSKRAKSEMTCIIARDRIIRHPWQSSESADFWLRFHHLTCHTRHIHQHDRAIGSRRVSHRLFHYTRNSAHIAADVIEANPRIPRAGPSSPPLGSTYRRLPAMAMVTETIHEDESERHDRAILPKFPTPAHSRSPARRTLSSTTVETNAGQGDTLKGKLARALSPRRGSQTTIDGQSFGSEWHLALFRPLWNIAYHSCLPCSISLLAICFRLACLILITDDRLPPHLKRCTHRPRGRLRC